ncbi:hypothetical protein HYV30_02235 [Candidatus Kaiserbacteria bacterium]|nr:hypothetical protein [Candidatus Kaiserbacteria bacterium]
MITRRLLAVPLVIIALGAAGANAPAAHAQALDAEAAAAGAEQVQQTGASAQGTAAATAPPPAGGNITTQFKGPEGSASYNFVMAFVMNLFGWLMGVAALTLNYAVFYTVVTMGTYVHKLSAIGLVWQIMRDIGNIILIFGFLAAGIATILNFPLYGWSSKALPKMLMAAVLINFSLFIAEAVIDTSNLFATQFYNQIYSGPAQSASVTGAITSIPDERISNAIMAKLGLQRIFGEMRDGNNKAILDAPIGIGFLGILLFLTTAVVLFALAFILIARFVVLLYLIITAPIGFASWVMPNLSIGKDWWKMLLQQAITAPVLLLLLYVALRVILHPSFLSGFGVDSNSRGFTEVFEPGGSILNFGSVMLSFLVAMGLLAVVIIAAKKMAAFGADWATKTAFALTVGATAAVGRRSVGRLSNYTAQRIRSSGFGRSEWGRFAAGIVDRGAKATYDIRGTKTFGTVGKKMGFDAGAPPKGGYKGREDELTKARVDYAKSLKQTTAEKAAEDAAKNAKSEEERQHKTNMKPLEAKEQEQLEATKELVNVSREELKLKYQALEDARKSGKSTDVAERQDEYNRAKESHADLVKKEREKLEPIRREIEIEKLRHDKVALDLDTKIKETSAAPQLKYARALEPKMWRAPYDWPTAVGGARREAKLKIEGEAKKGRDVKLTERLEAILEKEEKLAAPPPPTSGGGAASS